MIMRGELEMTGEKAIIDKATVAAFAGISWGGSREISVEMALSEIQSRYLQSVSSAPHQLLQTSCLSVQYY